MTNQPSATGAALSSGGAASQPPAGPPGRAPGAQPAGQSSARSCQPVNLAGGHAGWLATGPGGHLTLGLGISSGTTGSRDQAEGPENGADSLKRVG